MSEMIERVARAMRATMVGHDVSGDFWGEIHQPQRDRWTALARAAIEAMREPTEGMLAAPLHEADGCDAQYQTDADFAAAWAAMIEAAIK